MKSELKIRFPCGYEVYFNISGLNLFGKIDFDTEDLPICPIHGDKCKRIRT